MNSIISILLPILFLASLSNAVEDFEVNVEVDKDEQTSTQSCGTYQRDIRESDRPHFGLATEEDLIDLSCQVNGDYYCQFIKAAFIREADLDKRWNNDKKPYVRIELSHQDVEVIDMQANTIMLKDTYLINDSTVAGTFRTEIYDEVTDTIESNWQDIYGFSFDQTFSYNVGFLGSGGGGSTSIGFSGEWAKGGSESTEYSVGSMSGVEVHLQPGEGVHVVLEAKRGTMKIRTTYKIRINGDYGWVLSNGVTPTYPIWAHLSIAKRPYELFVTEEIDVGYYSEATVRMQPLATNRALVNETTVPAQFVPKNTRRGL